MKVKNKTDNKIYTCYIQEIELNDNGKKIKRYNIGIENHQGFHNIHCIYNNEEFNEQYELWEI